MSLSRTEQLSQRHLVFFNTFDEYVEFFEELGAEVSVQEVTEILGTIAVIFTYMEVE